MYESIQFTIQGVSPLLMHNGQLANPLNEFSKALKVISGKRKKTESDHLEMGHIEFLGSLYLDEKGCPAVPGENLEAAFTDGAKKQRMGEQAKSGIICDGIWPVQYDGPKNAESLWKVESFRDVRRVRIGTSAIMRTRPIFRNWRLTFVIQFLPDLFNRDQVIDTLKTVGRQIGLCDYTPKFGRFEVSEVEQAKKAA